ncbi:unnamed protein product [Eruca vesicaria subsp. sativa]|uniref:MATH domain-containing protein n=1 Tax=Eruca vesicaria subsp. sativa TaxID=29727 RepID=A0ABC8K462_ERUVS|nr:unnamed protein product [Eruca vesicaria subsp. sativa]
MSSSNILFRLSDSLFVFVGENGIKNNDHLSLFLEVDNHGSLPIGWRRHVKFSLTVSNQLSKKLSVKDHESQQWYEQKSPSWGRLSMLPLNKLHAKDSGFLLNGDLKIFVEMDVLEVIGKLDVSEETSTIMETMDVNGFQIVPSHAEYVSRMFEKHSELASEFRPKNQNLRTAYISFLLSLIETMCQSPQELSQDDLSDAHAALGFMRDAGFKLDWLEKKLDEVAEKKNNEKASQSGLQEMEEDLRDLKRKCSDMEALVEKEKVKMSAAKAPLSFDDVVYVIFSSVLVASFIPVCCCTCRYLIAYPKGNNSDHLSELSLFLEVDQSRLLPIGWRRHANFSFTVLNQRSKKLSRKHELQQWFEQKSPGWGRQSILPHNELHAKDSGFLVNGDLKIFVEIDVLEVIGKLDVSEETSTIIETMDVNGFQILPLHAGSVSRMFERHSELASEFRPKNPNLRTAYISFLLSLIETMCQSPQELSQDDLSDAHAALGFMRDAGFKLDWLEKKLDEVAEKKNNEEASQSGLQEMEEDLRDLKRKCSDMEALVEEEKEFLSRSMGKEVDNKFTWVIRNFSSLQSEKIYSDEFVVGGCKWRLLAFPNGNGVKCLSLYLDVAGSESLPHGWRRRAELSLSVVNQVCDELSENKVTEHWFDARDCDFGYTSMLPLDTIYDKDCGFLVNGDLKIVALVKVFEVIGKLDVPEETESLSKVEEDGGVEASDFLDVSLNESMDVNGFQVLPSQLESVSRIFERHPDIASQFRPKNQHLRTAYINVLLSLIKTLCQSTQELSKEDLNDAYASLAYLTDAGMNLDWLEEKLEEMSEKKEKQEAGEKRMKEIEEELKDLKLKFSNLEAELEKEKADVSVARAPLSFDDVV